ncbi:GNAT family N-acetyltransferase [Bdellovibrio sp. qaytius]|nr:GNAT family N-acetyltransferase [Bdellovibrio sp. qaytius]
MGSGSSIMDLALFKRKFNFEMQHGRYLLKTLENAEELKAAFRLRYKVFQVEMIGLEDNDFEDHDAYDFDADHLGIFDAKSGFLIATCRLNHSDFCKSFYSEQEFTIQPMLENNLRKLELGRVCVHNDYRKGIIIILLWRAIAKYIEISKSDILFGCGSVSTEDPEKAYLLYRYLLENNKIRPQAGVEPTEKYKSPDFERLHLSSDLSVSASEAKEAEALLPPLCRSYFDIGCFVPTKPAFDADFKCIDFLTVLNIPELDPQIKKKLFGDVGALAL